MEPKDVLELGSLLVEELGLDNSVDTLGRWMAHHVAELISNSAKASEPKEKKEIDKNAFETILKLWEHIGVFPSGSRPFEDYEPIVKILQKIDPDKKDPFYYNKFQSKSKKRDLQKWIDVISELDRGAKVLIDFSIKKAGSKAMNKRTSLLLEKANKIVDSDNFKMMMLLTSEKEKKDHKEEIKLINSRIEKIDALMNHCKLIRSEFVSELENLKK